MHPSSKFKRALAVIAAARSYERQQPKKKRSQDEREFLPAAVEILETPASPLGQAVGFAIMMLAVLAVAWAYFGKVDTVAVATGKIVPGGQVKVIQPFERSVIEAVHVREGQLVQAGDVLIDLDPVETETDLRQTRREFAGALLTQGRIEGTLAAMNSGADFKSPLEIDHTFALEAALKNASADPDAAGVRPIVATEIRQMMRDIEHHRAAEAGYHNSIERLIAAQASARAEKSRLDQTIPLLTEREADLADLLERGLTERWRWLEVKQRLIDAQQQSIATDHRIDEIAAESAGLGEQHAQAMIGIKRELLAQLAETQRAADVGGLQFRRAEQRAARQKLRTPVDGVIQQLKTHTIGGIVTPAEPLMTIVPTNVQLEIEAVALNKDIGFIKQGHAAEIKVEAFPFTRYGLIDGSIISISADAVTDEKLGPVYPVKVAMATDTLWVDDRDVRLVPGMTVSVEIKTGDRRVIDFFLSPFKQYQNEALKER